MVPVDNFPNSNKNKGGLKIQVAFDKNVIAAKTITLNDLTDVINFDYAILVMDIEDHEGYAMEKADKLFNKVKIPFVLMEWFAGRWTTEYKFKQIPKLMDFMYSRGYWPHKYVPNRYELLDTILKKEGFETWPIDIIWKHRLANFKF